MHPLLCWQPEKSLASVIGGHAEGCRQPSEGSTLCWDSVSLKELLWNECVERIVRCGGSAAAAGGAAQKSDQAG